MNTQHKPPIVEDPSSFGRRRNVGSFATVIYGIGGAFLGYVLWHLLGSLEDWQYYAIRSAVTGEIAMSRIIAHPADRWVVWGLVLGFIFGGTFARFAIARREAGH